MNAWTFFALILAGFGILFIGIYMGENNKVIEDRRNNRIRMINGADSTWLQTGLVAVLFSSFLALIGTYPPEKMKRADQIRLETTTKESLEH